MSVGSAFAVGLGVSPSRIINYNLVRGSSIEKDIVLSRSEATDELFFTVQAEGDVANWVTTSYGDSFTIPAGTNRFPVRLILEIPNTASNGAYDGAIRFISSSKPESELAADNTSGGNNIDVKVNALVQFDIEVSGAQLKSYNIPAIDIPAIEKGWPLQVVMTLENEGNVDAAPTSMVIEVWDKYKTEQIQTINVDSFDDVSPVGPFTQDDFVILLDQQFEIEQYWALIKVYDGQELTVQEDVVFEVVPEGSIQQQGELTKLKLNTREPEPGEIVKLEGVFKNTGSTSLVTQMFVEVEKDGKLVEIIESSKTGVAVNSSTELVAFFKAEEAGTYQVAAHVEFGGKKSNVEKEVVYAGGIPAEAVQFRIFIISILFLIAVAIFVFYKRGKK